MVTWKKLPIQKRNNKIKGITIQEAALLISSYSILFILFDPSTQNKDTVYLCI